ncbi:hypothetical protein ON010_g10610 [Phytophthora cinnamomi]|nr:hypothetical protein ON010_g10610 [Phytophthora cinnamomi]
MATRHHLLSSSPSVARAVATHPCSTSLCLALPRPPTQPRSLRHEGGVRVRHPRAARRRAAGPGRRRVRARRRLHGHGRAQRGAGLQRVSGAAAAPLQGRDRWQPRVVLRPPVLPALLAPVRPPPAVRPRGSAGAAHQRTVSRGPGGADRGLPVLRHAVAARVLQLGLQPAARRRTAQAVEAHPDRHGRADHPHAADGPRGFGRIPERGLASPDGAITYFNASACTHNYDPVNAPFVFELTGPPKRGWLKHTLPSMTPSSSSGLGIRRSFSTNDVSSISSLSTTDDEDVDMDADFPIHPEPRDYALMLHEWLRQCSHKPPFIEKKVVQVETCQVNGKGKLREFRVEGTTSGLLFESTLKIRPVTNVQKRALRYLFSQGFRSNSDNYKEENSEGEAVIAQKEASCEVRTTSMEVDSEPSEPTRERRKYGISRRVTVAVLDDIDEVKEGMDDRDREHVQQARVAAAALGKDPTSDAEGGRFRRPRRNKTLQRRSAVPMLASLTEEPGEGEKNSTSTSDTSSTQEEKASGDAAASEAIVVAPPIVECALCKYKVPGHIHPGVQPPPPPVTVVTPAEDTEVQKEEEPSEQRSRADNPPPKRLSSWF